MHIYLCLTTVEETARMRMKAAVIDLDCGSKKGASYYGRDIFVTKTPRDRFCQPLEIFGEVTRDSSISSCNLAFL